MAEKKVNEEVSKEEKIISKINSFVTLNRKWILIGLSVVVVALLALIIVTSTVNKNKEKAFIRVASYSDQMAEMIESSDSAAVNEFLANIEKEIKGSSYKSVKAAYLLGQYYAAKEDWAKGSDYFMKAYNLNSKIYIATLSLYNAAVCYEEQGDTEKALSVYTQIADSDDIILRSKAMFNVARINLQKGNKDLAVATFQQLIDMYPASEYSKIAENVISTL